MARCSCWAPSAPSRCNGPVGLSYEEVDETRTDFLGNPLKVETPYVEASWFGEEAAQCDHRLVGAAVDPDRDPVHGARRVVMERGLIKHFYKRPHADQILVTFGLAIVLQEIVKYFYGANPIPTPAPDAFTGSFDFGVWLGLRPNTIIYPYWRLVYFAVRRRDHRRGLRLPAVHHLRHGGARRHGRPRNRGPAGHQHRQALHHHVRPSRPCRRACRGDVHADQLSPNYHMGMDFLVLSFVVVVVGGMGSLPGAVLAGFLLGILESFASMTEVIELVPGINQIIIYLVAIIILLTRPRGLMGRKGVMEE
jgi:branched-chain amino acid transport system permease protein